MECRWVLIYKGYEQSHNTVKALFCLMLRFDKHLTCLSWTSKFRFKNLLNSLEINLALIHNDQNCMPYRILSSRRRLPHDSFWGAPIVIRVCGAFAFNDFSHLIHHVLNKRKHVKIRIWPTWNSIGSLGIPWAWKPMETHGAHGLGT